MFEKLAFMMQNNAFLRVSTDTTTCGSPLKLSPTGGLRLPAGKHASILTDFQTKVNKKIKKFPAESAESANFYLRASEFKTLVVIDLKNKAQQAAAADVLPRTINFEFSSRNNSCVIVQE
jgi:hypothetical protein